METHWLRGWVGLWSLGANFKSWLSRLEISLDELWLGRQKSIGVGLGSTLISDAKLLTRWNCCWLRFYQISKIGKLSGMALSVCSNVSIEHNLELMRWAEGSVEYLFLLSLLLLGELILDILISFLLREHFDPLYWKYIAIVVVAVREVDVKDSL